MSDRRREPRRPAPPVTVEHLSVEGGKPPETPLQRATVAVILVCVIVLAVAATVAGVRALL